MSNTDVKRGEVLERTFAAPDGAVYTLTEEDIVKLANFAHSLAQMFKDAAYNAPPIDSAARTVPPALPDEVD
jgi:hypothetical protein